MANRNEHLKRLGCADIFLDTPAYGAHTVGCDALFSNVPMISLLRDHEKESNVKYADHDLENEMSHVEIRAISTRKLASRVGASLLQSVDLGDLVFTDMQQYEDALVRCALDTEWFRSIRQRLSLARENGPLFDTHRWVHNLEASFVEMTKRRSGGRFPDIVVRDVAC